MSSMWVLFVYLRVFFFKQKTAYEMRISDWSSDVCSSDLRQRAPALREVAVVADVDAEPAVGGVEHRPAGVAGLEEELLVEAGDLRDVGLAVLAEVAAVGVDERAGVVVDAGDVLLVDRHQDRKSTRLNSSH